MQLQLVKHFREAHSSSLFKSNHSLLILKQTKLLPSNQSTIFLLLTLTVQSFSIIIMFMFGLFVAIDYENEQQQFKNCKFGQKH